MLAMSSNLSLGEEGGRSERKEWARLEIKGRVDGGKAVGSTRKESR